MTPAAGDLIEDKCLRCHAPAQQYGFREENRGMRLIDLAAAGEDGVACTVCHQISAASLGTRQSFTGAFVIDRENRIFGPHTEPFVMPMLHHTGYTPAESQHILESSLCGTCHTVITPTLAPDGRAVGEFIEQAPYLEWLVSDFPKSGVTCQSCHVPPLRSATGELAELYIAHRPPGGPFPPTRPRSPFGLHFFAGSNTPMLRALADIERDESPALKRNAERALTLLKSAVELNVTATVQARTVEVVVDVDNRAGHKLPTGFPSRRLWLHVRLADQDGTPLFESGDWDEFGEIVGAAGYQPHHAVISRHDQVMIYEAVHSDTAGRPTTSLLRAAGYSKDNRILPRGFDVSRPLPGRLKTGSIGPVGLNADRGFRPGSHQLRYRVSLRAGSQAARVLVEACYQSISPADAGSLGDVEHPDVRRFLNIYKGLRAPVVVARKEIELIGGRPLSPRSSE